jgi:hypothetical protein
MDWFVGRWKLIGLMILAMHASAVVNGGVTWARAGDDELRALKAEMEELRNEIRQTIAEKEKKIESLERQVQSLQSRSVQEQSARGKEAGASPSAGAGASSLDRALTGLGQYQEKAQKGDLFSHQVGGATLRLMDLSLDIMTTAGSSTERDESIETLQGGAHDPKRRGFTFQQAELGIQGAVDPYFTGEAYIVFSEEEVELEEAYFRTSSLPFGLQAKGGLYLTEFGIINSTHPHSWDWIDQPVINTRIFGGEGSRGAGARLSWLTPLPWYSELTLGMQNANSETMVSFLGSRHEHGEEHAEEHEIETTIGGRTAVDRDVRALEDFLYMARWESSCDLGREVTAKLGLSGLLGPNNTGPDGYSLIYGADFKVKWRPLSNERGWPFIQWQSEIMARGYRADAFIQDDGDEIIDLPRETLHDWGFYTQILYGFHPGWAAGLRYEYAGGSGDGGLELESRDEDPFRCDRHRISPLLAWYPSEFSRFRLQYNYDHSDHLDGDDDAHSVWLGAEFLIGSHPAHKF